MYKVSLNKFSGMVLVSIRFPDHDEIKSGITNKKIQRKTVHFWKLNTSLTTHGLERTLLKFQKYEVSSNYLKT